MSDATLVLVRHGETAGQSQIRLNGCTDVPLSDLGRAQIRRAAEVVRSMQFDRAFVSTLTRSQQSHAILSDLEPVSVHDLREIDFGDWEALTWAEVEARDPQRYREARSARKQFQYPNGDSRQGFYQRVATAASTHLGPHDGATLATLHKGVIKIAIAALCDLDWDTYRTLPCELGSIHTLTRVAGRWTYVGRNRVDHLGDTWLPDHPPHKPAQASAPQ